MSETVYNLLPGLASGQWKVFRDGQDVPVTEGMLLPKSVSPIPAVGWECPATIGETFLSLAGSIPVKPDTDYTISWVCDRDTDPGKFDNFQVFLLAQPQPPSGDWIRYKGFAVGGGKKHFSATFHTGSDWESAYVRFDNNRVSEGETLTADGGVAR